MIIFYICIFLFGASLASFINATLYRIEKGYNIKKLITEPSHCEECNKVLTWYELFPILGYIFEKGKCPKCKKEINVYYPISEFILGTSFLLFYHFEIIWYLWIILILLFILTSYDIKENHVPRNVVHILLLFSLFIFLIFIQDVNNFVFPILFTVVFLIINLIKKSVGFGDILILLGVGILMNFQTYISFFWLSIFIALLGAIVIMLKKKTGIKNTKVPMVPFFYIAFVVSVIYGEQIYDIFLKTLLL